MSTIKDFSSILAAIKKQSVGKNLCNTDGAFSGYNNRLWINSKYETSEPLWREENIIFCNGWLTPQTLIREKYLAGV